jgi:hypothetical protein
MAKNTLVRLSAIVCVQLRVVLVQGRRTHESARM